MHVSLLRPPLRLVGHVPLAHGPLVEHDSVKLVHVRKQLPVVRRDAVLDLAVVVDEALLAVLKAVLLRAVGLGPVEDVLGATRGIQVPE